MLEIPSRFYDEVIAHAREDAPDECCGILAGKDGGVVELFRAANADRSPYRYNVDPQDLFRIHRECEAKGWDFLAIYHSHTHTEAYPSLTDIRLAFWPESYYVIVSVADADRPVVRAFRILDSQVREEELRVV